MAEIDRTVIEGLRRGDDRAYEVVIDELHRPVYRFLLRLCGNASTSEDLTQETFLAVWQGIGSFQGKSRFKTWVFGIAYRQHLRFKDRKTPETVPLDEDRDQAECDEPSAVLHETERRRMVREAVHSLPDLYREAVSLVHIDGLTYREASEVLGIPVGTLKSRMNSAFQLLREKLGVVVDDGSGCNGSPGRCEVDDDEVRQSEGLSGRRAWPL